MKIIRIWAVLFLSVAMLVQTSAQGLIVVDDPSVIPPTIVPEMPAVPGPANPRMPIIRPGPNPPQGRPLHRFTPLETRSIQVNAKIRDQAAETRIEQEFYNPGPNRLEGTFYLPLPKGAHLKRFALEVNGKMTEAELLSADKAKGIYEEIVRKALDPALLEYVGRDLVKVRIFPIEPHSSKKVEVSYTQLLKNDAGLVEFTLPLSSGKHCQSAVQRLALKIELESSKPLKSVYSASHNVELKRQGDKRAVLGLEESGTRPDKDFQLFFSAHAAEVGLNLLTHQSRGGDGYFMLLATPAVEDEKVLPKDVVFVLDTSGSMAGQKLEQAKKALNFCIANLNERDRFEVIRFSTEAENLFRELASANHENRLRAKEFVDKLKPTGGTAINDALLASLKAGEKDVKRPLLIVFLTDGLPTVGITSERQILENVRNEKADARVFCFGVGTGVNTHLLDKLAEETRAVSQYVLPHEDLEVKLSSFFSKISEPVLSDVTVDFTGVHVTKMHPSSLPDLFNGQQVVLFGRYQGGGAGKVTLAGTAQGKRKEYQHDVSFANGEDDHAFIPRLWATRRVGYLLDEIRLRGENRELREEVTSLAKEYGIVTPYTSYLATEDVPVSQASSRRELGETQLSPAPEHRLLRLSEERSGDAAVVGARYSSMLKAAVNADQLQEAPVELKIFAQEGRFGAPVQAKRDVARLERFAGGRVFRFNEAAWIDAAIEQHRDQDIVRLEFNSSNYWQLVGKHPELAPVLALGTEVKFMLNGKVYEIFSNKK